MPAAAITSGKRTVPLQALRAALRSANPMALIRSMAWPEPPAEPVPLPQLALWVVDGEGLPLRPWRLYADSEIDCRALGCSLSAGVCVTRQLASQVQRTKDTWRGEASSYPTCVTERCAQGRGIREALDPAAGVSWRGCGPGGRFEPAKRGGEGVARAKARLGAVGLLDNVSTCDGPAEGAGRT